MDLTRDIRSNITLWLHEFPRASPLGTPSGKGLYLTVYPSSFPNTDIGLTLPFQKRFKGEMKTLNKIFRLGADWLVWIELWKNREAVWKTVFYEVLEDTHTAP